MNNRVHVDRENRLLIEIIELFWPKNDREMLGLVQKPSQMIIGKWTPKNSVCEAPEASDTAQEDEQSDWGGNFKWSIWASIR